MEESIGGGSRAAVQDMNEFLRAACVQHDCLYYLGQKGFARSRFEIFKPDGVHFIFFQCSLRWGPGVGGVGQGAPSYLDSRSLGHERVSVLTVATA